MKRFFLYSILVIFIASIENIEGQEVKSLTFDEVIKLSEEQSPNALMAKHRFRASYWQYRTFVAQYRPSLTLTGTTPEYSNSYDKVWNSSTNGYDYQATNTLSNLGSLALSQNIGFTGGTIFMNSDFTMFNDFENNSKKYITTPLSIGLTQPLFRYNALKWQKKTEPLKFEAAKKTFLANIEAVHQQAVMIFFSLAQAQINKQIAAMNYSNADTLIQDSPGKISAGNNS